MQKKGGLNPSFLLQVLLLIDIELSYMNTNHEDFIGFAKSVAVIYLFVKGFTLECVLMCVFVELQRSAEDKPNE